MLIASSVHIDIITGAIASVFIIGGALIGIGRWGHDKIVNSVKEELAALHAAVTPNGGSSLRDAVDRTEKAVDRQGVEIDRQGVELDELSRRFEHHLGYHEGYHEGAAEGTTQ